MSDNSDLTTRIDAVLAHTPTRADESTLLFGALGSGIMAPTGFDPDELVAALSSDYAQAVSTGNHAKIEQTYGMISRILSISDISAQSYRHFADNPVSMAYWLPIIHRALTQAGTTSSHLSRGAEHLFAVPATKILRLSPELAQYTRREFGAETNAVSVNAFDAYVEQAFDLVNWAQAPDATSWFIKTGTFSNKFEFRNTRCTEADEMGQYFHLMTNQAMMVGAGDSVDLVVRRWIDAPADTPEIYRGMPLRTEVRAFIDMDAGTPRVLGITPYWHPQVMKSALKLALDVPGMGAQQQDYHTWQAHSEALAEGFDRHREPITQRLEALLPHLHEQGLSGTWSVDIMVDECGVGAEPVYWLIDMATMHSSALVDVLAEVSEYAYASPEQLARAAARPENFVHDPVDAGHMDDYATDTAGVYEFSELR